MKSIHNRLIKSDNVTNNIFNTILYESNMTIITILWIHAGVTAIK